LAEQSTGFSTLYSERSYGQQDEESRQGDKITGGCIKLPSAQPIALLSQKP
jgi:hypothetical protein